MSDKDDEIAGLAKEILALDADQPVGLRSLATSSPSRMPIRS